MEKKDDSAPKSSSIWKVTQSTFGTVNSKYVSGCIQNSFIHFTGDKSAQDNKLISTLTQKREKLYLDTPKAKKEEKEAELVSSIQSKLQQASERELQSSDMVQHKKHDTEATKFQTIGINCKRNQTLTCCKDNEVLHEQFIKELFNVLE